MTSFVLGYHGCDAEVAERLLAGEPFKPSENRYDWLGHGIYFWEANPDRGLEFAHLSSGRTGSAIAQPAVVGAVLDLGLCLDMTTSSAARLVARAYASMRATADALGAELPRNSKDMMRRDLDCAVINRLHEMVAEEDVVIDTVKGIFVEDDPIYVGSGFHRSTHVQIAVRNPGCIKGVFRVPRTHLALLARETGTAA